VEAVDHLVQRRPRHQPLPVRLIEEPADSLVAHLGERRPGVARRLDPNGPQCGLGWHATHDDHVMGSDLPKAVQPSEGRHRSGLPARPGDVDLAQVEAAQPQPRQRRSSVQHRTGTRIEHGGECTLSIGRRRSRQPQDPQAQGIPPSGATSPPPLLCRAAELTGMEPRDETLLGFGTLPETFFPLHGVG
jgi:hypothetical protein